MQKKKIIAGLSGILLIFILLTAISISKLECASQEYSHQLKKLPYTGDFGMTSNPNPSTVGFDGTFPEMPSEMMVYRVIHPNNINESYVRELAQKHFGMPQDAREYWDGYFGSDYDFVSAATCVQNCHGYATGKSIWINGDAMDIILEDDYIELFGEDIADTATIHTRPTGGGPLHSVRITGWDNGKITETHEKYKSGPVYKRVYSPGIETDSYYRYWKPK